MSALKTAIFLLFPAVVAGSGFLVGGESEAAVAARVGIPFLVGLGLAPASFCLAVGRRMLLLSVIGVASCAGAAFACRGPAADPTTVCVWIALTYLVVFAVAAPFLALASRALAACAWILTAAALCGTLAFVVPRDGAIPQVFLEANPLVRMFHHGLGFDWLHAANVYPRVGTSYYRYPARTDGIAWALAIAGAGISSALLVSKLRRPRTSSP